MLVETEKRLKELSEAAIQEAVSISIQSWKGLAPYNSLKLSENNVHNNVLGNQLGVVL